MSKAKDSGKEPKTSIQINRTFGTANLLELYSDYIAKKICEEVKNS
jgi:hypothetical protein